MYPFGENAIDDLFNNIAGPFLFDESTLSTLTDEQLRNLAISIDPSIPGKRANIIRRAQQLQDQGYQMNQRQFDSQLRYYNELDEGSSDETPFENTRLYAYILANPIVGFAETITVILSTNYRDRMHILIDREQARRRAEALRGPMNVRGKLKRSSKKRSAKKLKHKKPSTKKSGKK